VGKTSTVVSGSFDKFALHGCSVLTCHSGRRAESSALLNLDRRFRKDPDLAQSILLEKFEIAERWNAVVLIEYADIFLEKREVNHMVRHRLVPGP
jgi:hypothetical protein